MTDQLAVTIRFKDLPASDATIAAKELISELQALGIPSSEISLGRSNADNQDLGTLVLVSAGSYLVDLLKEAGEEYLRAVAQGAGQQTGRQLVNWILRKWQTRAEISCSDGRTIELGQSPPAAGAPRARATSEAVASLKSAAVVVLGASQFPGYPSDLKLDNVAFKQSADITKSLLSETNTVFKNVYVLDLFDAEVRPDEIVDRIEEHITKFSDIKDVIIYYCGHGDFLNDREKQFYLLLKSTRQGREVATGLKLRDFRIMLEQQAHLLNKRCYFIIDSCFSGAAVDAFQGSSIEGVVNSQVEELLPPTGMAFLTAADRKIPAIGNDGKGRTMFSGAFADVLNGDVGSFGQQQALSLSDLKDRITQRIKTVHGMAGVLPQCHAPQQVEGDVSKVPIFVINPVAVSGLSAKKSAAAGSLTSEEKKKAEELLSWDLVKDSSDITALERHLARFPDGITRAIAEVRIKALKVAEPGSTSSANNECESFSAISKRKNPEIYNKVNWGDHARTELNPKSDSSKSDTAAEKSRTNPEIYNKVNWSDHARTELNPKSDSSKSDTAAEKSRTNPEIYNKVNWSDHARTELNPKSDRPKSDNAAEKSKTNPEIYNKVNWSDHARTELNPKSDSSKSDTAAEKSRTNPEIYNKVNWSDHARTEAHPNAANSAGASAQDNSRSNSGGNYAENSNTAIPAETQENEAEGGRFSKYRFIMLPIFWVLWAYGGALVYFILLRDTIEKYSPSYVKPIGSYIFLALLIYGGFIVWNRLSDRISKR